MSRLRIATQTVEFTLAASRPRLQPSRSGPSSRAPADLSAHDQ